MYTVIIAQVACQPTVAGRHLLTYIGRLVSLDSSGDVEGLMSHVCAAGYILSEALTAYRAGELGTPHSVFVANQ